MKRIAIEPRHNWQAEVEKLGFGFHTIEGTYWDESAYYAFSMAEIETIETATAALWQMCLDAVEHVIQHRKYDFFHIPQWVVPHIEASWHNDVPSIYGRFDFSWQNGLPKLLEFNADTPTSLFEAAVVQWHWLEQRFPHNDQFNSLHERLIETWRGLKPYLNPGKLHFACAEGSLEDLTTTQYMRETAHQAGIDTDFLYMHDIGWDGLHPIFVDTDNREMTNVFKLYPWEWLVHEAFGQNIVKDINKTCWIEPSWKMLLSNKAILPVLYALFPESPYLLPAYFDSVALKNYVKKPILSREGANITVVQNDQYVAHTEGEYGAEGYIYQELATLPHFDGHFALIGSWVVGQEPAGIGIRESNSMITDNGSRFVPHIIV